MCILISNAFATYKAQIRSSVATGFKQLYTASCTSGPQHAARRVVEKHFGPAAAQSVRKVTDPTEIRELIGDFMASPQRKQVFDVWTFIP